eukprot:GCRY01001436.1.p1 GENE.GCRY01001436.1~~GCRY01001436.1.p1  ORF type:complete len:342 (+),score=67.22 GCRY01001436.1:131-1027(+)
MTMLFTISQPYSFVYGLGVLRFDDFLKAATEEAIRRLVRDYPHTKLLDMRGTFADKMIQGLNDTFVDCGVIFTSVNITDVRLPEELMNLLTSIQTYSIKTQSENAKHRANMERLNQSHDVKMKQINREQELKVNEYKGNIKNAQLHLTRDLEEATIQKKLTFQDNATKGRVRVESAQNRYNIEYHEKKNDCAIKLSKAKAQSQAASLRSEAEAHEKELAGEAEFRESENITKAMVMEANAEKKAAEAFRAKRLHELELRRLEVLTSLSRNGRVVISGDEGTQMISSLSASGMFGASNI